MFEFCFLLLVNLRPLPYFLWSSNLSFALVIRFGEGISSVLPAVKLEREKRTPVSFFCLCTPVQASFAWLHKPLPVCSPLVPLWHLGVVLEGLKGPPFKPLDEAEL